MADARPIGVFDSGVGGLTVLHEIHRLMPAERLIYIADLLHFPYGPRYQSEVRDFALRLVRELADEGCKLVVIACNTATAAALDRAREQFDIPVVGVIAPGARAAVVASRNGRIGVISTAGTHASQAYVVAIREADPEAGVLSKAVPELVELVEAGRADSPQADAVLRDALQEFRDWGADTLVLGCTHYPLLTASLARVLGDSITVVDSAANTAARVVSIVETLRLGTHPGPPVAPRLIVTADPAQFSSIARRLFGEALDEPEVINPWADAAAAARV